MAHLQCGFLSTILQIMLVFRRVENWSALKYLGNSTHIFLWLCLWALSPGNIGGMETASSHLIFLWQLGSLLFVVSYDAWLFLSLAISWQTSQWSVNSCKIDQSATPFLGWQRVCLLQKCSQSVFSRLVLISHCNITSWFAIALAEIRTTQIYFNRKGWLHAVEGWQVL